MAINTSSSNMSEILSETERFVKYFFYKASQTVIQSRQGHPIQIKPRSKNDPVYWFSLIIEDLPDITTECRHQFARFAGSKELFAGNPLCIEMSLTTAEGDSMALEVLSLTLTPICQEINKFFEKADSRKSLDKLYRKLSYMLRGLTCSLRAMPSYKLSRRQSKDSYIICYRMYSGDPNTSILETPETRLIGKTLLPFGYLQLRGDYRPTEAMTFSPSTPSTTPNTFRRSGSDNQVNFRPRSDTLGSRGSRFSEDSENFYPPTDESSSDAKLPGTSPARGARLGGKRIDESFDNFRYGAFVVGKKTEEKPKEVDSLLNFIIQGNEEDLLGENVSQSKGSKTSSSSASASKSSCPSSSSAKSESKSESKKELSFSEIIKEIDEEPPSNNATTLNQHQISDDLLPIPTPFARIDQPITEFHALFQDHTSYLENAEVLEACTAGMEFSSEKGNVDFNQQIATYEETAAEFEDLIRHFNIKSESEE